MKPICVARHLVSGEKAEDTDEVGTVEHLGFKCASNFPVIFNNFACHFVIIALRPFGQATDMVDQGCFVVFVDRLNGGYPLY